MKKPTSQIKTKNMLYANALLVIAIMLIMPVSTAIPEQIHIEKELVSFDTIYVDDDGGADYTNIPDAVANASNGDTIFVYDGSYSVLDLVIDKQLTIQGESQSNTKLRASNTNKYFIVTTDGVTIESFSFNYGGLPCIYINCSDTVVSDCLFQWNGEGIRLDGANSECTNNIISDCIFDNNGQIQIKLIHADGNKILNTELTRGQSNIELIASSHNEIRNCHIHQTKHTPGIGLHNETGGGDVPCSGNLIADCTLENNYIGIGIGDLANNNYIYNNFIANNTIAGMKFTGYPGGGGITNTIQYNSFVNNAEQVVIQTGLLTKNYWDDGYGGNHWSNWETPDADGDGIVDKPYEFNGQTDEYPLVSWHPAPPQVELLYPTGEDLLFTTEIPIEYDVKDIYGASLPNAEISIYYKVSGGDWVLIEDKLDNTGEYVWIINESIIDSPHYKIRVGAADELEHTGYDETKTMFAIDATDPTVNISRPELGDIYLFDSILINLPLDMAVSLGKLTIITKASDEMSGIAKVTFESTSGENFTDTEAPYRWNLTGFGKQTVTVSATDGAGRTSLAKTIDIFVIALDT